MAFKVWRQQIPDMSDEYIETVSKDILSCMKILMIRQNVFEYNVLAYLWRDKTNKTVKVNRNLI
jgi:hypothetical protein